MSDKSENQVCPAPCPGGESTFIVLPAGEDGVQEKIQVDSYTGDFPSPLQFFYYTQDEGEQGKTFYPDPEIRSWIKDAADYHGVPHELMALIMQQENAPGASTLHQIAQFGERSLTTLAAVLDEYLWDLVPDAVAGSSSGFVNMSRSTLRDAAEYVESNYPRGILPEDVRYRLHGEDVDSRIPGDDWKADLYYASGHLRQLIDDVTGERCYSGPLTLEQIERIAARYNGTGPKAEKYGSDALQTLMDAVAGDGTLYFYQK